MEDEIKESFEELEEFIAHLWLNAHEFEFDDVNFRTLVNELVRLATDLLKKIED